MTLEERVTDLEDRLAALEDQLRPTPSKLITREEIERGINLLLNANKGDVGV